MPQSSQTELWEDIHHNLAQLISELNDVLRIAEDAMKKQKGEIIDDEPQPEDYQEEFEETLGASGMGQYSDPGPEPY